MGFGKKFTQAQVDELRMKQGIKAPSVNKKVRNAVKSQVNGIDFASKLELYAFNLFKAVKIDFEFQKTYVLQEKFDYNGSAIRPITIIVDFYLPAYNMICDTKGFANDVSPVKYKMLKHTFKTNDFYVKGPEILLLKDKEEVEALVNRLVKFK